MDIRVELFIYINNCTGGVGIWLYFIIYLFGNIKDIIKNILFVSNT